MWYKNKSFKTQNLPSPINLSTVKLVLAKIVCKEIMGIVYGYTTEKDGSTSEARPRMPTAQKEPQGQSSSY